MYPRRKKKTNLSTDLRRSVEESSLYLSQRFFFEAAHTLKRSIDSEGSLRIHGHTYEVEVTIKGPRRQKTGMVLDLEYLRRSIARVRRKLDHHLLDDVKGLGPATLENLCVYIFCEIQKDLPAIFSVSIERRASGDRCVFQPAK